MKAPNNKDLTDLVMAAILEFGRHRKISIRAAATALCGSGGIDFLSEFYDVEHSLSFNDCVDDMTIVCRNNGGTL